MTNWKHYAGSTLLAGLLLQGCGSSEEAAVAQTTPVDAAAASKAIAANTVSTLVDSQSVEELALATTTAKLDFSSGAAEDATSASDKVKAVIAALVANGTMSQADADYVLANTDLNELYLEAYFDKVAADEGLAPANLAPNRALSLDFILDPIKDGLVSLMDTSVGGAVTSATFDVVLNSEGVTVVMLDMARGSETMTQIMIDALGRDWSLTAKMCPMLQTNQEFGEKFAALAEESDAMGRFFFERVDAPMYGCLTDAMLLSNDDAVHHESVSHSTNAYMGILMERYAADFFIEPGTGALGSSGYGRTDTFAGLMFDTGANVDYNGTAKTFENHGDANELINEQFFYSLFKTPGTTDAFVAAMNNVEDADALNGVQNTTLFMDKIFLGANNPTDANPDTYQGYLNIISIGSGMYEGIYGKEGSTAPVYGFGSYTDAFIGFAGLIPADRYLAYGKAFIDAGYMYAGYNGINVWDGITNTAQAAWDDYTAPEETAATAAAPSRSAGLGTLDSDWLGDITDLFVAGWGNFSLTAILDAFTNEDTTVIGQIQQQANIAYSTVLDGRNDLNEAVYPTQISNGIVHNDTVYGFHGLIELAMQEDIYFVNCGNKSTDYITLDAPECTNNPGYTIDDAKAAFTLPPFAEITWSFAYGAAKDGVVSYWDNNVNVKWLADLSTTEFVQNYFYPSEDGIVAAYVPNWMMAIDWLKLPNAVNETNYDSIDLSFDGGYVDVYFVSTVADLAQINEVITIELVDDSMIAQDAEGTLAETRYLYKIRAVSPEQVSAALAYLQGIGEGLIGLDTDNAAETVATAE